MSATQNNTKAKANSCNAAFDPQNMFSMFNMKNNPSMDKMMQTMQKNMEASAQLCQMGMDCMMQLANAQSAYMQSMTEQAHTMNQSLMSGKADPKESMEKTTDMARKAYEECMDGMKKASKLIEKTNADMTSLITKRTNEAFEEMKKTA